MEESCGGADRLPRFDLGEGVAHPAGETQLHTRHLSLELRLWPEERRFEGQVELKLQVIGEGLGELCLDAAELQITAVEIADRAVPFQHLGHRLRVALAVPPKAGSELSVRVRYAALQPRFGLFFLEPDAETPNRPRQVWTQGQDDYTRYWLPCLDAPNQKATSEVRVEVPEAWEVISNGRLVDVAHLERGRRRFHWSQELPHSPYLISVTAGEFASWHEEQGGVRFSYHVPRGREADGKRAFARTPQMVALFAKLTGVPYPWAKYSQVCVADFIFGGMENTSATTLTERTLHDERGNLDQTSDALVAHELAHQWFGDLVTCRSWSHGWLNEGFATYFEHLWTEHHLGADELEEELLSSLDTYLDEDQSRYRRPIVEDRYQTPSELFDRHLYQKGAWVLHQLRRALGDRPFFASLRHYLEDHRGGSVETVDLARAIEKTTGKNLDPFFAQWVLRAGHPELEGRVTVSAGRVSLRLKQTQAEEPFAFPLRIAIEQGGELQRFDVQVSAREERFDFPVKVPPACVVIDPELSLLARWALDKPEALWVGELQSPLLSAGARGRAARGAARAQALGVVPALRERLLAAPFWGEGARMAEALGELRGEDALEALLEATAVAQPKARRAVARALGQFRDPRAVQGLDPLARHDPSYLVEGEALKALARTRQPGTRQTVESAVARESDGAVVRRLALEGLGESRDRLAVPTVQARTRPGEPVPARVAAVVALGKLGEDDPHILDALIQLLEDRDFYVRIAACEALAGVGNQAARGPLERLRRRDPSGRVQRAAGEAVARLGSDGNAGLRAELDALRGEVSRLRQEVATLRPPAPTPKAGQRPKPTSPAPRGKQPSRRRSRG